VIICDRKQGHYSDRRICEMVTLNEIHYNSTTFFVSSLPRLKYLIPKKNALAYRIDWEIYTP
jgi:hypothetical protein